jgi:hypothetical protein
MILHIKTNKNENLFKIIIHKYKNMQLKTYDVSFDDATIATYKKWKY